MANPKYLTAAEARQRTNEAHTLHGEYMRGITEEIVAIIERAASKGDSGITYQCNDRIVERRLVELGYKVRIHSDQRDGDYMTISW